MSLEPTPLNFFGQSHDLVVRGAQVTLIDLALSAPGSQVDDVELTDLIVPNTQTTNVGGCLVRKQDTCAGLGSVRPLGVLYRDGLDTARRPRDLVGEVGGHERIRECAAILLLDRRGSAASSKSDCEDRHTPSHTIPGG